MNSETLFSFQQKELQNVEDAENELLMREDDSEQVPYPLWNMCGVCC